MKRVARQSGVVTIIFIALVFVLISLLAAYGTRSILFEQDFTNNHSRARIAFEAAEAGLNAAKDYLSGPVDRDADGNLIPNVFDTDGDGVRDSNITTDLHLQGLRVEVNFVEFPDIGFEVSSTGFSDDRSATHTVWELVSKLKATGKPGDVPIVTRGLLNINGSATVTNQEGHSTIWGGKDVNLGSNNATATNVADVGASDFPACMDKPMTCDYIRSSNRFAEGLDVIENDTSLSNLSSDQLFAAVFGVPASITTTPKEWYRRNVADLDLTPAEAEGGAIDLAVNRVIWIDGDTVLRGLTVGCEESMTGSALCTDNRVDTADSVEFPDAGPSIIIVNGDLTLSGTPNFTGLLYVTQSVYIGGNATVVGQMIVEGDVVSNTGGSLDLWFNSSILQDVSELGVLGSVSGTWRDF